LPKDSLLEKDQLGLVVLGVVCYLTLLIPLVNLQATGNFMRVFLALIIGIIVGAAGLWYLSTNRGSSQFHETTNEVERAAKSVGDNVQEKLKSLNLRTNDIKDELVKTGQVIRKKSVEAGHAIADATADARITAVIKGKLLTNHDLSALSISVNTTAGVVTLSGAVSSTEDISKAMLLAMETDGVHEVISTLQVKAKT
jgi:osmotically-inducible protein OsmY